MEGKMERSQFIRRALISHSSVVFYYLEGIYGVIYSNATAEIGIKNRHHRCHQRSLQLKILPGQQVGNFCHQSIIQKSQLDKGKKKAHTCAHTENPPLEIKSMQRMLEGLGRRGEASCSLGPFSTLCPLGFQLWAHLLITLGVMVLVTAAVLFHQL